jgi:hypothetical protein
MQIPAIFVIVPPAHGFVSVVDYPADLNSLRQGSTANSIAALSGFTPTS